MATTSRTAQAARRHEQTRARSARGPGLVVWLLVVLAVLALLAVVATPDIGLAAR